MRFKKIPRTATVVAALAVLAGTSLVSAALLGKRAEINPQPDAPVEALHIRGTNGQPIVVAPSPQTGGTVVASVTVPSEPVSQPSEAVPGVQTISPGASLPELPIALAPQEVAPSPSPTPWLAALAAWGKGEISEVLDDPRGKVNGRGEPDEKDARNRKTPKGKARGHYKGTAQGPVGLWRKGRSDGPEKASHRRKDSGQDEDKNKASGKDKKTKKSSKARRQRTSHGYAHADHQAKHSKGNSSRAGKSTGRSRGKARGRR